MFKEKEMKKIVEANLHSVEGQIRCIENDEGAHDIMEWLSAQKVILEGILREFKNIGV